MTQQILLAWGTSCGVSAHCNTTYHPYQPGILNSEVYRVHRLCPFHTSFFPFIHQLRSHLIIWVQHMGRLRTGCGDVGIASISTLPSAAQMQGCCTPLSHPNSPPHLSCPVPNQPRHRSDVVICALYLFPPSNVWITVHDWVPLQATSLATSCLQDQKPYHPQPACSPDHHAVCPWLTVTGLMPPCSSTWTS